MSEDIEFTSTLVSRRDGKPVQAPAERDVVRILVADEHKLVRELLRHVLSAEEDFEVVDEAAGLEPLPEVAARVRPDIVLFDIDAPHPAPVDVVRRLRRTAPTAVLAVLSGHDDIELIKSMMRIGVRCYLHKEISCHDLVAALRGAVDAEGKVTLTVPRETFVEAEDRFAVPLSRREQEVLALVAAAMSNRQIAVRLSVTEGTVKRHLRNIFHKLGAVSRIDAVNKFNKLTSGANSRLFPDRFIEVKSG